MEDEPQQPSIISENVQFLIGELAEKLPQITFTDDEINIANKMINHALCARRDDKSVDIVKFCIECDDYVHINSGKFREHADTQIDRLFAACCAVAAECNKSMQYAKNITVFIKDHVLKYPYKPHSPFNSEECVFNIQIV